MSTCIITRTVEKWWCKRRGIRSQQHATWIRRSLKKAWKTWLLNWIIRLEVGLWAKCPGLVTTETNVTNNRARSHSVLGSILESPVNLTCMFLDGGRKPEDPHIHGDDMQTPHRGAPAGIQTLLLWGDHHHTTVRLPLLFFNNLSMACCWKRHIW